MLYLYITTLKRKGGEFGENTKHLRKVNRFSGVEGWSMGETQQSINRLNYLL